MQVTILAKEISKSMKSLGRRAKSTLIHDLTPPARSSIEQKIDLLRAPTYQKRRARKKSTPLLPSRLHDSGNGQATSLRISHKTMYNIDKKNEQNVQKSVDCKKKTVSTKTFQSWFRRKSGNIQEPKSRKNIINVLVMEKEIQKDNYIPYQKNIVAENAGNSRLHQDSQAILRKSSLYMLNFIKRKQKCQHNLKSPEPHIGGIPNLASNIVFSRSPIKKTVRNNSRSPRRKVKDELVSSHSKTINSMLIEPW